MLERELPQDLDAEKAVLGSMMMSAAVVDEVVPILLGSEPFFVPAHRLLYHAIVDQHDTGDPMDLILVSDRMRRAGTLEAAGGQTYMIELAESFADWANGGHYARLVRAVYHRRNLISVAHRLEHAAYELERETDEICATFAGELERIPVSRGTDSIVDAVEQVAQLPGKWQASKRSTLRTGILCLDDAIGGLEAGSLVHLAGRPSTGKTSIALRISLAAALADVSVLFVSIETNVQKLSERLVAMLGGQSVRHLRERSSPTEQEFAVRRTVRAMKNNTLFLVDALRGVREICATARAMVRRRNVGLIVIDYVQIMLSEGRVENRNLQVAGMSAALQRLAKDTNAVVLALGQMSRHGAETVPTLRSLRDSGALEQDADVVILLHRDEAYRDPMIAKLQLIVAKNRDGPIGEWCLDFHRPTMALQVPGVDMSASAAEEPPW